MWEEVSQRIKPLIPRRRSKDATQNIADALQTLSERDSLRQPLLKSILTELRGRKYWKWFSQVRHSIIALGNLRINSEKTKEFLLELLDDQRFSGVVANALE